MVFCYGSQNRLIVTVPTIFFLKKNMTIFHKLLFILTCNELTVIFSELINIF